MASPRGLDGSVDLSAIVGVLAALTIFCWIAMLGLHATDADRLQVTLVWMAMTVGMMTPSAVPMITTYARVIPRLDETISVGGCVLIFVATYLGLWALFAMAAAELQTVMRSYSLIGEHMQFTTRWLSAIFLICAGIYQITPLKHVCVSKCRSPLGFLLGSYRPGYGGAFVTGLRHGLFCIGCCWLLMCLVWIGGMMNLTWMAALSLLVIVEKIAPATATRLTRVAGAGLVLAGLVFLVSPGSAEFLTFDELVSMCVGKP